MLKENSFVDDRITFKLLINRIPAQRRKVIFVLLASALSALILALLASGVAYGGRSFMPISRIDVTEILNMERADILARAGIENQTYWTINKADVRAKLLAIAAIKDAVVEKHFPNTLVIKLETRKPAAMVMSLAGGAGVLLYVDETGKVFEKGRASSNMHLPLITDARMQNPYAGAQFPFSVVALLKTISNISSASLSHISEIEINWKIVGEYRLDLYDLIIYPKSASIRVRMNAELDDAYIRRMLLAVKTVGEDPRYSTDEIDYRSHDPAFIPKGGAR
ncbi:MAG: FtsQ-type POTRA domain-containing protein [Treponema sp.]|jgi:cell division protein FtsQ|nr:FtsQ-type POTRA domain-containing protein [Treponema sp.]